MWVDGLPKEVGFYWFYGWTDKRYKDEDSPELYFMRVAQGANSLVYSVVSHFVYKSEALGKYCKIDLPELPNLEE